MALLGCFITFHTYGSWLHGCADGSVDDGHDVPGMPFVAPNAGREECERRWLKGRPIELDAERRFVVDATVREVCGHRGWRLHALHVRTTHVHAVVSADRAPERMMLDFKAYATRRMREAGVLGRGVEPWSRHGSTRYLNTEVSFWRAVRYALDEQGEALPMVRPVEWRRNEPRA